MVVKDIDVKSIITKSNIPASEYAVNPYVGCAHACRYCYASFMKRFTNHPEPWGSFVDVKHWDAIKNKEKYRGKKFFLSSVTDPYQPIEKKVGNTRLFLEQMQGSGIRLSLSTKSDLILRDLDLLKTFPDVRVSFSINTLDENFRRQMDDGVSIERRLEAMKVLYDNHIRTTCFISPIFPGITDVESIIKRVEKQCNLVWLENLNLRGDYKAHILQWIHENHPELDMLYHDIYALKHRTYWNRLNEKIRDFTQAEGLWYLRDTDDYQAEFGEKPIVINYFYHEEIIPSAKREQQK